MKASRPAGAVKGCGTSAPTRMSVRRGSTRRAGVVQASREETAECLDAVWQA